MPIEAQLSEPTWLCLAPCLVVFVLAALTRRTVEPLLIGVGVGLLLIGHESLPESSTIQQLLASLDAFCNALLAVLADEVIRWIVLVCGLFGSLIHVQTVTGGAEAIGVLLARCVRGPLGVRLATWLLGLMIFVDDYLNAMTVGSTMRGLADRFGVSRAMLAYLVDSTAAPVCVLVPASTWALYVAGLLEAEGVAEPGGGVAAYVGLLGTFVYAWAAAATVLIVVLTGWPLLPPMRGEELAAREAVGDIDPAAVDRAKRNDANDAAAAEERAAIVDAPWLPALVFVLPLAVLIGAVLAFGVTDGNSVLKGVLLGVATALLLGWVLLRRRLATLADAALEGFGRMAPALAIVVVSFVLRDVNEQLGLTDYLIGVARPWLSAGALPAVAFVGLSLVTFVTGSFWGTYAIALPIVVPLAQETGASVPLAVGAVVSAGAFGSHACFYGDATVLSSVSCGVPNMTHALTQLPYALLAATATVIIYLVWGFAV
ncbi:MAG: Na+/H+ antiporter NhaC family protein [Planctomycetota bacterium]